MIWTKISINLRLIFHCLKTSVVPGPREPETKGKVEVVEEAQDDEDAGHVTTDSFRLRDG